MGTLTYNCCQKYYKFAGISDKKTNLCRNLKDSLYIEKITILKKDNKSYIIVDLNDDLNIKKFTDEVSSDVLRMMVHFYPDEKDVDKIISKEGSINQDFKPNIMDFKGNEFLFSKLENKTTSEINFYKFANFTFYTATKGRGNVLTLFDLQILRH